MEAACLDKGGDKVISVTASCRDTALEALMLSSNGFEGYQTQTYYTAGASMTAQGEGDRRPNGYNYMTSVQKSGLPSPSTIGVGAAERTLELLGSTKIKTETLPIIIENRNGSRLLNGLLAGMYGSNIQQKRSFLADKKGKNVGSDHFTLIDDPLIKGGLGSQLFDNDGISAKKRTMIDKGRAQRVLGGLVLQPQAGVGAHLGQTRQCRHPSGQALRRGDHERPGPGHPDHRIHRRQLQFDDRRYLSWHPRSALRRGENSAAGLGDEHRRQPPRVLEEAGRGRQRSVALFVVPHAEPCVHGCGGLGGVARDISKTRSSCTELTGSAADPGESPRKVVEEADLWTYQANPSYLLPRYYQSRRTARFAFGLSF